MVNYFYYNWGPYLFKTETPQHIIDRLKIDGKKSKALYNDTLAGHLEHQYSYSLETRTWFAKEISEIMDAYLKGSIEYHGNTLPRFDRKLELTSLWINYMKPGDFNPIHVHSSDYSFVIFLDVPSEIHQEANNFKGTDSKPGALQFRYGQPARPAWGTTENHFIPNTGDMYIFPALLEHIVAPFKSDVTRISVSGNYRIANKNTKNWKF